MVAACTKDEGKPGNREGLARYPAFKPYRGKLAVRNFRGGDGDVGIIRSPVRAIALPDNRHAVENERVLQERSSEPPGLESCGGSREAAVEA
jgi:hypothetical protein